jgi:hypothetical protein
VGGAADYLEEAENVCQAVFKGLGLVERVRTTMFVSGVRFKIIQQGEPKMLVLDASDETVEEILDYAQARGASVGGPQGARQT